MDDRRLTRSRLVAALVAAVSTAGLLCGTSTASAALLGSSTTALNLAIAPDGTGVVMTATVTPSLGGGTVTFTDEHKDALGTAELPSCLLSACTVSDVVPTSALSRNVGIIVAIYSGNGYVGASYGLATLLYVRCPKAAHYSCRSIKIKSTKTVARLLVPPGDSALLTLGGPPTPCSIGSGPVVNVATTGKASHRGKGVQVGIVEHGSRYQQLDESIFDRPAGHLFYRCNASSRPFPGFTPATGADYTRSDADFARLGATPIATTGTYSGEHVGLLADCLYLVRRPPSGGACGLLGSASRSTFSGVDVVIFPGTGLLHLAG